MEIVMLFQLRNCYVHHLCNHCDLVSISI